MKLPLYLKPERAPIELVPALDSGAHAGTCTRCALHEQAKNVCLPAEGEPGQTGGVLLVGDHPGAMEDKQKRVFTGPSGQYLRTLIRKLWDGPVTYDNALRCYNGHAANTVPIEEEHATACRGFLHGTLNEAKPDRVVALGIWAAYSLLGPTGFAPLSMRRAYGWLLEPSPVPVFMLPNPVMAAPQGGNRFIRKRFEADLEWALTCPIPDMPPWKGTVSVVMDEEESEAAAEYLEEFPWFSFDVETAGYRYNRDFRLLSLSACPKGKRSGFAWHEAELKNPFIAQPLRNLLRDESVGKVGHNLPYDLISVKRALDVQVRGIHSDTKLKMKLIEPEADAHLAQLACLAGYGGHKDEANEAVSLVVQRAQAQRRKEKKPKKVSRQLSLVEDPPEEDLSVVLSTSEPKVYAFGFVPRDTLLRYNCRDAIATTALEEHLQARLEQEPHLNDVWLKIVRPAIHAVEYMENIGVGVSAESINLFQSYLEGQLSGVRARLAAHGDFNPDSFPQTARLLYDKLKLTPPSYTDSGAPCTDEDALKQLAAQGAAIATDLLSYRGLRKMQDYAAGKDGNAGLLVHVRDDGRIHPTINLDGARSGRTSCQDPNLQNIPRAETEEGKMARDCFVAAPGHVLLSADYSQLELRVAAMLSGDTDMKAIFEEGVDYHLRTAQLIAPFVWGVRPENVTKAHRSGAKAFNFGILYGMSDEGIASRAGCTLDQAASIRQAILGKFKKLDVWIKKCQAEAQTTGYAWTWWDGQPARHRFLWRIGDNAHDDYSRNQQSKAIHSSWNGPVQGTASDFCVASCIEVVDRIERDGLPAKLMLPIHDALLLEVPVDHLEEVAWEVRQSMCSFPSQGVPLAVDMEVGPSWGSLTKYLMDDAAKADAERRLEMTA